MSHMTVAACRQALAEAGLTVLAAWSMWLELWARSMAICIPQKCLAWFFA